MAKVHAIMWLLLVEMSVNASLSWESSCGQRKGTPSMKNRTVPNLHITGGEEIEIVDFPWIAYLLRGLGYRCGATIVRSNYWDFTFKVVTAAHCFDVDDNEPSQPPDLWSVRAGCSKKLNGHVACGTWSRASRIDIHPLYMPFSSLNDIAIVSFHVGLNFGEKIQPICLPPADEEPISTNSVVQIAGWGNIAEFPNEFPNVLRTAAVKVADFENCARNYANPIRDRPIILSRKEMLCASAPGKDACQGDSGGPLVFKRKRGYTLEGIISFGKHCAHPRYPGVYTRVSNYVPWLEKMGVRL